MPTVADLLPAVEGFGARLLAGPAVQQVREVLVVDEPSAMLPTPAGAALLLTPRASRDVAGYRLDVLLRLAAEAGAALVAGYGLDEPGAPARRIADRAGIAIVGVPAAAPLTALVLAIEHALQPDAAAALARIVGAHAAIERHEAGGAEAVLEAASRALGAPLRLEREPRRDDELPVLRSARVDDPAEAIVRRLAAEAVARIERRERRSEALVLRSRAQLVQELMTGSAERAALVADRARAIGLPVDGWHRVARLETSSPATLAGDPLAAQEALERLASVANRVLRGGPGWVVAVVDLALVVCYMDRHEAAPPPAIALPDVERMLAAVRQAEPALHVVVGLGAVHVGVAGLRTSAAEARSALEAARAAGRSDVVSVFDATGVRRMLVEWMASDTARGSVDELLAPLDALGPAKGPELVRTLGAYLAARGSLRRAARTLHLHPNAVAYRMRAIVEQLGCDLDDPDQHLALQLACRARQL